MKDHQEDQEETASQLHNTVDKVSFNVEVLTDGLRVHRGPGSEREGGTAALICVPGENAPALGHVLRVHKRFSFSRSLWTSDTRLLVSSLLAPMSVEIFFIGNRVEQNNCCDYPVCVRVSKLADVS